MGHKGDYEGLHRAHGSLPPFLLTTSKDRDHLYIGDCIGILENKMETTI